MFIILVESKLHLNFLDGFFKHFLIRKFMKTRPVGTELFYADRQTGRRANGQTDRDYEVTSRLSKFYLRSHKVRRNWGTGVKTEKLGKEELTVVTIAPVPENQPSLALRCIHLHIQP